MKTSYGVSCVRFNINKYEMLLVKKRYSYNFVFLINGRYNSSNKKSLRELFCGMTVKKKKNNIIL